MYKEEFHTIYNDEQGEQEFKGLLSTMKVVDSKGESALDQDQWDAASEWLISLLPFFRFVSCVAFLLLLLLSFCEDCADQLLRSC